VFFKTGDELTTYFQNGGGRATLVKRQVMRKLWEVAQHPLVSAGIRVIEQSLGAPDMVMDKKESSTSSISTPDASASSMSKDSPNRFDKNDPNFGKNFVHDYPVLWDSVFHDFYKDKLPTRIHLFYQIFGFAPLVFWRIAMDGMSDASWVLKNTHPEEDDEEEEKDKDDDDDDDDEYRDEDYDEFGRRRNTKKRKRPAPKPKPKPRNGDGDGDGQTSWFAIPEIPDPFEFDFYVANLPCHEPQMYAVLSENIEQGEGDDDGDKQVPRSNPPRDIKEKTIRVLCLYKPDPVTGTPTSPVASLLSKYDFNRWLERMTFQVLQKLANPLVYAQVREQKPDKPGSAPLKIAKLDGIDVMMGNTESKAAKPLVRYFHKRMASSSSSSLQIDQQRFATIKAQREAMLINWQNAFQSVSGDFRRGKYNNVRMPILDSVYPLYEQLEMVTQPPLPKAPEGQHEHVHEFASSVATALGIPGSWLGPPTLRSGGDLKARAMQDDRHMFRTVSYMAKRIERDCEYIEGIASGDDRILALFKLSPNVGVDIEAILAMDERVVLSKESVLGLFNRHYGVGVSVEEETKRLNKQKDDDHSKAIQLKKTGPPKTKPSSSSKKKKTKTKKK